MLLGNCWEWGENLGPPVATPAADYHLNDDVVGEGGLASLGNHTSNESTSFCGGARPLTPVSVCLPLWVCVRDAKSQVSRCVYTCESVTCDGLCTSVLRYCVSLCVYTGAVPLYLILLADWGTH